MTGLTWVRSVRVPFTGSRDAEGPLTIGQLNILEWLARTRSPRAVLTHQLDVPPGIGVDDVAAAFGILLTRHEGLRTVFRTGVHAFQRVVQAGELLIEVYSIDGSSPLEELDQQPWGAELARRMRLPPWHLATDLPVRVAVATRSGVVCAATAVYSHLAADAQARAVLGAEFAELAGKSSASEPGQPPHQPIDQAQAERGPAMQRRLAAALRHWEDQLLRMPPCTFAVAAEPGPSGIARLSSPAAAMALDLLAARTATSRPAVVLAAVCAVLARRAARSEATLMVLSSNRFEPALVNYVGTLAQAAPVTVEVGSAGFDELVRRAFNAMARGYRHGMYDAFQRAEAMRRIGHDRGAVLELPAMFNNLAKSSHSAPSAEMITVEGLAAAVPLSELRWRPTASPAVGLRVDLHRVRDVLEISIQDGNGRPVGRAEIERLLLGVERLLVAAAFEDVGHSELGAAIGLEPLADGRQRGVDPDGAAERLDAVGSLHLLAGPQVGR